MDETDGKELRRGWTTGACATAATKAAYTALLTGAFPDPVTITLPKGQTPSFALARTHLEEGLASAGVIKDAGDDPDVTHGAMIIAHVRPGAEGSGVTFRAGPGVGMVTKPGLPIPPGEAAINPVPRKMMCMIIEEVAEAYGGSGDVEIEIEVPDGDKIAKKTWNGRLGIVGGISILGTTGIVVPYSCSAWIHSIHRGIDVARAEGTEHVAACVGSTSERMVLSLYGLPETSIIDMGDFVGGMLKYLKRNPLPKMSIAGGFGKMSKLAAGALDLHSKRSQVDTGFLAGLLKELGADSHLVETAKGANTGLEILQLAEDQDIAIGYAVADHCLNVVRAQLGDTPTEIEILICDRDGRLVGRAPQ